MKWLYRVFAVSSLLCLVTAWAADSSTHQPTLQGFESVNKNAAENPDNKGLQNARERLARNIRRHESQGNPHTRAPKSANERSNVERPNRVERVERVERS